jgi:selenocysteine lyase/cysteine desulfurase
MQDPFRSLFPRAQREVFLNAAGGTPLGTFADRGLRRYMDFQRLGPGEGRDDYVGEMRSEIRGLFGGLIGAQPSEIAWVHCTKAGEQVVIDGLETLRRGGNIVTNDMHFTGSLHNLVGLRRSGRDVRIVMGEDWDVSLEAMDAAIDTNTALVTVSLVSNINGRVEPLRELAEIAHARGALVFADIIQAAGIVPMDVRELGVDFAACNGYKWLYGVHGAGFLYVREDLQGTALPDRLFPGHVTHNYPPWVEQMDPDAGAFMYDPRTDASRYEPGHVSYLGYCAVYEGLKFISQIGVEAALRHSVRLNQRLQAQLDPDAYACITPNVPESAIITFVAREPTGLEGRLRAGNVVVGLSGNRIRVSPAVFNDEADVDALAEALS